VLLRVARGSLSLLVSAAAHHARKDRTSRHPGMGSALSASRDHTRLKWGLLSVYSARRTTFSMLQETNIAGHVLSAQATLVLETQLPARASAIPAHTVPTV